MFVRSTDGMTSPQTTHCSHTSTPRLAAIGSPMPDHHTHAAAFPCLLFLVLLLLLAPGEDLLPGGCYCRLVLWLPLLLRALLPPPAAMAPTAVAVAAGCRPPPRTIRACQLHWKGRLCTAANHTAHALQRSGMSLLSRPLLYIALHVPLCFRTSSCARLPRNKCYNTQ